MLSESFDISEFISKVKGQSELEIIHMADLEATEAERHLYKHKKGKNRESVKKYATTLKDFVLYMRYGVQTTSVRQIDPIVLDMVCAQ
jgi:hypothetical protein